MNSFSTTNSAEIQTHYPAPSGDITTSISDRHPMGIKWIGEDGWVFVDRGKIDASNRQWIQESFDRGPIKARVSLSHHRDFLDGIRSRKTCFAPADTGHRSIMPGHLGLISQIVGKPLRWNAKTENVIGNPEADALLKTVEYRSPWKFG